MSLPRHRLAATLVVALLLAAAGACTGGPATQSPGAGSASPTARGGDAVPSGTEPATQAPSDPGRPTGAVTPATGAPPAVLTLGDGGQAAGVAGSWAIDGAGSDAPWLPASMLDPVHLGALEQLAAGFQDAAPIGAWSAWIAAADDARGESATWIAGREAPVPTLSSVSVPGVEPGNWVLAVRLDRADGSGDATYYWLLVAD